MWRAGLLTTGDEPAAEGELVTPLHVRYGGSGS
jgi:hypothetical protein